MLVNSDRPTHSLAACVPIAAAFVLLLSVLLLSKDLRNPITMILASIAIGAAILASIAALLDAMRRLPPAASLAFGEDDDEDVDAARLRRLRSAPAGAVPPLRRRVEDGVCIISLGDVRAARFFSSAGNLGHVPCPDPPPAPRVSTSAGERRGSPVGHPGRRAPPLPGRRPRPRRGARWRRAR